jgi:hypothetical protein
MYLPLLFQFIVCGTLCSGEGIRECTILGGSARLRSIVSPTTAIEGTTLERRQKEEFDLFLVDEAMAFQGRAVQALPAQCMTFQAMYVQGMHVQAMPLQAMAVEAMPHQGKHRFRDFIIVVPLVVIAKLVFFS